MCGTLNSCYLQVSWSFTACWSSNSRIIHATLDITMISTLGIFRDPVLNYVVTHIFISNIWTNSMTNYWFEVCFYKQWLIYSICIWEFGSSVHVRMGSWNYFSKVLGVVVGATFVDSIFDKRYLIQLWT